MQNRALHPKGIEPARASVVQVIGSAGCSRHAGAAEKGPELGRCTKPGNPAIGLGSSAPIPATPSTPAPSEWAEQGRARRDRGRPWRRKRARILRRDCGLCQPCKRAGFSVPATDVDHKVALVNGGTDDDDNLEAICKADHRAKTRTDLGHRPKGCNASGWPTDPRHPWNRTL